MTDQEPTLWELMRAIQRLEGKLDSVLTVEVFRAYQEGTDRRFQQQETDLTEWKAESRGAHVSLDAKIEAVKVTAATAEQRQRATTQKVWLALLTSALTFLTGVGLVIATNVLNGGAG